MYVFIFVVIIALLFVGVGLVAYGDHKKEIARPYDQAIEERE